MCLFVKQLFSITFLNLRFSNQYKCGVFFVNLQVSFSHFYDRSSKKLDSCTIYIFYLKRPTFFEQTQYNRSFDLSGLFWPVGLDRRSSGCPRQESCPGLRRVEGLLRQRREERLRSEVRSMRKCPCQRPLLCRRKFEPRELWKKLFPMYQLESESISTKISEQLRTSNLITFRLADTSGMISLLLDSLINNFKGICQPPKLFNFTIIVVEVSFFNWNGLTILKWKIVLLKLKINNFN